MKTGFRGERCFVHARGGVSPDGREIIITTQPLPLTGCDVFYGLYTCSGAPMAAGAGRRSSNSRNCAAVLRRRAGDRDERRHARLACCSRVSDNATRPSDELPRRDDRYLHKIFPPSDFNCKCSVEDCDDEPDEAPQDVEPAESGFAFDPAHAFEEFDFSSISNPDFRDRVEQQMRNKFKISAMKPARGLRSGMRWMFVRGTRS